MIDAGATRSEDGVTAELVTPLDEAVYALQEAIAETERERLELEEERAEVTRLRERLEARASQQRPILAEAQNDLDMARAMRAYWNERHDALETAYRRTAGRFFGLGKYLFSEEIREEFSP